MTTLNGLYCILILFQDECNWILSGRDPLPDDIQEEDENTLDDISGDEVRLSSELNIGKTCLPTVQRDNDGSG